MTPKTKNCTPTLKIGGWSNPKQSWVKITLFFIFQIEGIFWNFKVLFRHGDLRCIFASNSQGKIW
jgi:hypothetical protein